MVGQFALSKVGHDKGSLYVIIAQEQDFLFLCDGKTKTPEKPKKKKRKHVQPICAQVEEALLHKLSAGEKVYPEEIKYAIKQYQKQNI